MTKTNKKILETAEKLFYRHGFGCVGVDTIRDVSGCSKTTMYNHFGNKENLIREVLNYRDRQMRVSLAKFVGDDVTGKEAIARIFSWHHNWFEQEEFNGCLFVRGAAELDDKLKSIALAHKTWLEAYIRSKLQALSCADQLAAQIMIVLEGMISIYTIYRTDMDHCEHYMEHCKQIVTLILDVQ